MSFLPKIVSLDIERQVEQVNEPDNEPDTEPNNGSGMKNVQSEKNNKSNYNKSILSCISFQICYSNRNVLVGRHLKLLLALLDEES